MMASTKIPCPNGCGGYTYRGADPCASCRTEERERADAERDRRLAEQLARGCVGDEAHTQRNLADFDAFSRAVRDECGVPRMDG